MTAQGSIIIKTEQLSGLRLCKQCNMLLPLAQFRQKSREYLCLTHFRATRRRHILGTHEKRAFNSLRCKARQDMIMFGHDHMVISRKQFTAMLTEEQMANFSLYCMIPRRPDKPLTRDNSIIVTSFQRKYIVSKWRIARDPDQYERDLEYILAAPLYTGDKGAPHPTAQPRAPLVMCQ